jgi:FAD/FMN-containing dehydrogenase
MTIELTRPDALDVLDPSPARDLRSLCGGDVHLPGDPGYDAARTPWACAVDQRPAAVAFPRDAADVVDVVRTAKALGLRVAPQSTGHNAGPLAAQGLDEVILVRTTNLQEVTVDAEREVVRVGSGAVWLPAVEAAAAAGLSVLHGSSPDVGIAGYSLGGGIGWYARKLGLAASSLTAVEMVTASGEIVRADADHHAGLFWALRGGGGGSFGVVTALEFRAYAFDSAYAGMLVWDISRAAEVLAAYAAWAVDAPDEVTTSFRILRLPPIPEIPEGFRGRALVVIDGAVLDTDERAAEILAPLRALPAELDTFGRTPSAGLVRLHMDPEGPTPGASSSTVLGSLPAEGVEAFLAAAGEGADTSLMMVELRQLGGALARPAEGGGVLSHIEGRFVAFAGGMALTPEMGARTSADAERVMEALGPWANGRQYLNFAEEAVDVSRGFGAARWTQLTGIRSAYDPDGLFLGNHPVPRLYEGSAPRY